MKKLILSIFVSLILLGNSFAADATLTSSGDVWAWVSASNDTSGTTSTSSIKNNTYAFYGLEVAKPYGDYLTKSVLSFEGSDAAVKLYQLYVSLESKSLTYKLGYFDPSDVTQGMAYLPFWGSEFYTGVLVAQESLFSVALNKVGLEVVAGQTEVVHTSDVDTTNDSKSVERSVVGVYYRKETESMSIGLAYVDVNHSINSKKGPSVTALAYGSYASQNITAGMNYIMGPLSIAVNIEQLTETVSSTTIPTSTSVKINFSSDYTFTERSGLTFARSQTTVSDGTSSPTNKERIELGFARDFDGLQTGVALFTSSNKDQDLQTATNEKLSDSSQGLVVGFYMGF